ncbi:MAG: ATP-binding protein [Candidatus Zixiibacteriota bacterium]
MNEAFAKASQLVFSQQATDFSEVLKSISENLNLDAVYVYRKYEHSNSFRLAYDWANPEGKFSIDDSIELPECSSWEHILEDGFCLITDATTKNNECIHLLTTLLKLHGKWSVIVIPIRSYIGELLGLSIVVDRYPNHDWYQSDLKPLYIMAEMTGVFWEQGRIRHEIDKTIRQYRAIIDTVPAIMYIKDKSGRYVEINKSFLAISKRTRDEIIGKTDQEIFSETDTKEFLHTDNEILIIGKNSVTFENRIVKEDGTTCWLFTEKTALYDDDGRITGLVGLTKDTTEEHIRQQQMLQTDKLAAIGTLAAGVAHEINNPIGYISSNLNAMKRYASIMREALGSRDKIDDNERLKIEGYFKDFYDAIEESIEGTGRVRKIVADLKSFSRVDKAEKGPANINDGIVSTINIVWNELKYKCTIVQDLGDIPQIVCYAGQINQVILNLLMNAGQAIKDTDGEIAIRTWFDNRGINISIRDNGIGIPEGNIKKIFEPFFTTKDVGKGTGLGLSLVFDIISKHDGTIQVDSEEGVGTEFHIWLPATTVGEGGNHD